MEAVLAQNRTPDVMPTNDILLSSEKFATQWKTRYSEGNVNMPGFQITTAVSMVLGLPILFSCVPQRSVSRFSKNKKILVGCILEISKCKLLCLIGHIYLYLIGDHIWGVCLGAMFFTFTRLVLFCRQTHWMIVHTIGI